MNGASSDPCEHGIEEAKAEGITTIKDRHGAWKHNGDCTVG